MAKILIVDDESNIRLMLRLALQASEHTTESAADGPEALEKFGDGATFDLVLLDQRMPAMDGLEVLRTMKVRDAGAKIIMVTAFGTVDLALAAKEAGATNFLRKPFTTEVLRSAVALALETPLPVDDATTISPLPGSAERVSVNGFRLETSDAAPEQSGDGSLIFHFNVHSPNQPPVSCRVVLSRVFTELVKAEADRDVWDDHDRFWLWLSEEALANYLWQNAALPPSQTLELEEISAPLRRWINAVGSL